MCLCETCVLTSVKSFVNPGVTMVCGEKRQLSIIKGKVQLHILNA